MMRESAVEAKENLRSPLTKLNYPRVGGNSLWQCDRKLRKSDTALPISLTTTRKCAIQFESEDTKYWEKDAMRGWVGYIEVSDVKDGKWRKRK